MTHASVRTLVLLAIAAAAAASAAQPADKGSGICASEFCRCAATAHPFWTSVNCTLDAYQTLDLEEGSLPESATEIDIIGGSFVRFNGLTFTKLLDIRRLRILGAGQLVIRRHAFLNLTSISTLLEIADSNTVHIEYKAFAQIKGPVTANITRCAYVSLEREAFSWLLSLSISNVARLELAAGAFVLENNAANVDSHGPEMTIHLNNVILPELSSNTFGSSAAEIRLDRLEVRTVRRDAFSANTFNVVIAINSSFHILESGAFAQKTLINNLEFSGCHIHELSSKALQSAMSNLTIQHSRIEDISEGAINITVATVIIVDNEFETFHERGFELQSWNRLQVERNSFNDMDSHAIVAPFTYQTGADIYDFTFAENEMVNIKPNSLSFVGDIHDNSVLSVNYKNNYYAQVCHCGVEEWLKSVLGSSSSADDYSSTSYCTVNEFFARCFNVPEENMQIKKFSDEVCGASASIKCEPPRTKTEGVTTVIKNTRFPNRSVKSNDRGALSDRDKKIIGLVFIIAVCGVLLIMVITAVAWIKRKGYCVNIKNAAISSNTSCISFFDRLFGLNSGIDNARSISRLSVNEYSERHRLNEPRIHEIETRIPDMYAEDIIPMEDKATQTLPEELTKELLESLREKLDDPENYTEAREMIEHLYELIKVEESCNNNPVTNTIDPYTDDENIYDLPLPPSNVSVGRNKKQMVSIGTRTPSLDKLLPFSPYDRQTALCHEYFEPKDLAIHLYAEITNNDREKKANYLSSVPDVVAEQPVPRGPFLRAMREKMNANGVNNTPKLLTESIELLPSPHNTSTVRSNKSIASNSSSKMLNRPLPEKPITFDPGEGTSFQKR